MTLRSPKNDYFAEFLIVEEIISNLRDEVEKHLIKDNYEATISSQGMRIEIKDRNRALYEHHLPSGNIYIRLYSNGPIEADVTMYHVKKANCGDRSTNKQFNLVEPDSIENLINFINEFIK